LVETTDHEVSVLHSWWKFDGERAYIGELRWDRMFTGFLRDLTERQQTQHRMQELQAELTHVSRLTEMGQMASTLAHEVNQPLITRVSTIGSPRPSTRRGLLQLCAR
jgi:hypothetical protein